MTFDERSLNVRPCRSQISYAYAYEICKRQGRTWATGTEACDLFELAINVKKTEVIGKWTNSPPEIKRCGESLQTVDKFVYLGSIITSTLSLDEELTSRIGKAAATF